VTSDLLIHWGIEGMRDHSPDVAVFVGLNREPDSVVGTFDLQSFGGRCELVVELVSPHTRDNDVVRKREHYHQIGIPLYVLIDQQTEGGPRFLRAYRRKPDRYVEIETDDKDRVDVPLLGLMIGLLDNRVVCYDLRTERELGDYARIARAWEESERAREQAREQIEQAMEEQVEARHKAERRIAEAQKEIDRQREEAERARKETDRQREETERAQKEADRQREEADRQRRAREVAENQKQRAEELAAQRIRDLEEMVRRLQGGGSTETTSPGD
jgi:colicin import membrane protein